ncbi:MAG TPA: glycosyltransferase family 39 protein, partial [Candidatus Dormibacteraeota bacterium]|nr:glycosyltransferase family 39 protein [Candidatus Dormibacteraeota bacterium]
MRRPSLRRPAVLLGCCVLLVLLGVSPWGLWERDEGRYADAARGMLESGDFVTPRIDGAVFLDKPPLVYWVTAASLALWGRGETGARFGQVLFAAGVLLVTRRAGILLSGRRRGNVALIILASSLLFFAAGHILTLDMALAFFVALALLLFLMGYRAGSPGGRPAYLGMFAAAAAAVLTKGPIGAVLPALTIACFLIPRGETRRAKEIPWIRGLLLFAVIVAPWYVAVSAANPEFPRYFLVHEHLERFATTVHRHPGAWWYYLAVLAAGLMPWSLMLPADLLRFHARLRDAAGAPRGEAPAFLWAWLAPGLVLFTLSQSKLALYVLPLLPAAALLLAPAIERNLDETTRRSMFLWPSSFLALVAAGTFVLRQRREDWEYLKRAGVGWPLLLSVVSLAGGAMLLGDLLARRRRAAAALVTSAFLWMAACYAVLAVVGRIDYFNLTKHFATVVRAERAAAEPVYAYQCYLRGL